MFVSMADPMIDSFDPKNYVKQWPWKSHRDGSCMNCSVPRWGSRGCDSSVSIVTCYRLLISLGARDFLFSTHLLTTSGAHPASCTIGIMDHSCGLCGQGMVLTASGVPRGGGFGVFKPPPKFWRYRWSPRLHKQEEPASWFSFVVHCVLIRL